MADPVYLSLRVRDFSEQSMLAAWAIALAEFPISSLSPGIRELAVHPFHWGETPVLEQSFQDSEEADANPGADVAYVVALASEFLHADFAYEAKLNWDVWVPQGNDLLDQWERQPQLVTVSCLGPQFEDEGGADRSDLLISLGLDSLWLPEETDPDILEEALEGTAGSCYRENIAQLLGYMRRLEERLPLTRRLLWSSSGEDLAEHIREAWGG